MAFDPNALPLALQRFDLRTYVRQHGGDREGRHEFLLMCPGCMLQKLSVNVEKRRWRCFRCEQYAVNALGAKVPSFGAGGVFQLVMWLERCTPRQAAEFLVATTASRNDPNVGIPDFEWQLGPAPEGVALLPTGLPENCLAVTSILPYMVRRGITLRDAAEFGLGWCPTGWVAHRLVFPVWMGGQCVYWQARAMWDKEEHDEAAHGKFRKTLNPARERGGLFYYGSGDVLGNLDQAATYPRVAITEGPTSGIRTGPSAIWTYGKQLQPAQIALLIRYGVRAVDFMWDGPTASEPQGAWQAMIAKAALLCGVGIDVRMVFLPRDDPGTYPREQLDWFRAQARPYGHQADAL